MAQKKQRKRRRFIPQNVKCSLCESGVKCVSYKDVFRLKKFITTRGRMIARTRSGNCHKHQKEVTKAIKRARYMALLPFHAKV